MNLLIAIVNYRTADLAVAALASLAPEVAEADAAVTIVDNASGDGSAETIEAAIAANGWGGWVRLVRSPRNGGFAAGNNLAVRPALEGANPPRHVLLLNPDAQVRPGALRTLLAAMDARPEVGIAGSRLELPDGTPQRSAFRFPTIASELEGGLRLGVVSKLLSRWVVAPPPPDETCTTDWVSGAAMMIRREVLQQVGLLDEKYFLYFEELDLCRRARAAGWQVLYVPASRVIHLEGQATAIKDSARRRPAYWFESRRRYFLRHLGKAGTAAADAAWTAGFSLWRVRRIVQRKPDQDPPHALTDFLRHSVFAKGFRADGRD